MMTLSCSMKLSDFEPSSVLDHVLALAPVEHHADEPETKHSENAANELVLQSVVVLGSGVVSLDLRTERGVARRVV